ncbi:MAG: hypothetical protein ACREGI_05980 [Candidatus Levyibacteriota bacterium]
MTSTYIVVYCRYMGWRDEARRIGGVAGKSALHFLGEVTGYNAIVEAARAEERQWEELRELFREYAARPSEANPDVTAFAQASLSDARAVLIDELRESRELQLAIKLYRMSVDAKARFPLDYPPYEEAALQQRPVRDMQVAIEGPYEQPAMEMREGIADAYRDFQLDLLVRRVHPAHAPARRRRLGAVRGITSAETAFERSTPGSLNAALLRGVAKPFVEGLFGEDVLLTPDGPIHKVGSIGRNFDVVITGNLGSLSTILGEDLTGINVVSLARAVYYLSDPAELIRRDQPVQFYQSLGREVTIAQQVSLPIAHS